MPAGGHHAFVFCFHNGRTNGGFFRVRKAKLQKRAAHGGKIPCGKLCNKRGGHAGHHRAPALQQCLYSGNIIAHLLCVLRAVYKAAAA